MKKGPMNPERWQKVESIFHKALDADSGHRASVLEDSCAGDESLRREVESLLTQHENAGEFIERPAFASPRDAPLLPGPRSGDSDSVGIPAGTAIGHYRIVGKIGSGGMGVVYEAEDLKLRRHVALKFLPEEVAEHPQALQRFRLEARAASALNHPNICTIHEVDEVDGRVFIAMELLEGQTLKQRMAGKPLPLETVIDFGVQIAGAINAAHSKGIVHRDIKPANIFVLKQHRIKVLDFGLAKLTHRHTDSGETGIDDGTEPGMMMGTVGYMSPEQVRGQLVDGRTDIFAFGAILYEMLAGRRAFEKPTSSETMAAILNEDPAAISQLAPNTPPALARVVKRCLEQDPEQRFQSASDLAFALEALSESSGATVSVVGHSRPSRRTWAWTAVAAGAMFALAWLGVVWWRTPPAVPVVESINQLTDDGEKKPIWGGSYTDGSRIYFNEVLQGTLKIAQVSVNGGPTALVDTTLPGAVIVGVAPDGSAALAITGEFQRTIPPIGTLWSIPLPAGEPRRLGGSGVTGAGYFPDGHIVFTQWSDPKAGDLFVAEKDGSNPRKLASAPGYAYAPNVSPDGKRMTFTTSGGGGVIDAFLAGSPNFSLAEVAGDGTGLHTLDKRAPDTCCSIWASDGKYLLYRDITEKRQDIWALPMGQGLFHRPNRPIRLTAGPQSYSAVSVSRDGKQIFAVGTERRGELVRYDMKSHQFLPFLSGISAIEPTFSRDGQWVAYISYPDQSVWRSRSDGSEKMQLTYPPIMAYNAEISPDGTKVAFTTVVPIEIAVVDMNGRLPPKTVAGDWLGVENWSPDGNLLLVDANQELRIFDMQTGKASVVPSSKRLNGFWIDQNTILGTSSENKFLIFDLRTQKWTELAAIDALEFWNVSPDGKYVYYETAGEDSKAWRLRFADRHIEMLTSMWEPSQARDLGWVGDIDIAPDGSPIFTRNIGTQELYALNVRWPK